MSLDQLTENEQSDLLIDASVLLNACGIERFQVSFRPPVASSKTYGTLVVGCPEHAIFQGIRANHWPTMQNVRSRILEICEQKNVLCDVGPIDEINGINPAHLVPLDAAQQ